MKRRNVLQSLAAAGGAGFLTPRSRGAGGDEFSIHYVLSSAMYGDFPLADILPEIDRSGSIGLDIWGKPHGTQREEAAEMGVDALVALLEKHDARLIVSTRYPLGPFGLQPEMPFLERAGGKILVCGSRGPKNVSGEEARRGMVDFLEKMKPHADAAGERGLVIAVENHANQLLHHPDSILYFAELNRHEALGVAFAPHHLNDHLERIPELIGALGRGNLPFIYFQEYGIGSKQQVAKEIELRQMPGKGTLDYVPILRALKEAEFDGVAEIFMHPTPRGAPVLPTVRENTDLINESRAYLETCLEKIRK